MHLCELAVCLISVPCVVKVDICRVFWMLFDKICLLHELVSEVCAITCRCLHVQKIFAAIYFVCRFVFNLLLAFVSSILLRGIVHMIS